MNFNKVNTITNELSNQKEYVPLGEIHINSETTVNDLLLIVLHLKDELNKTRENLATYKENTRAAFDKLQEKFETLSNTISVNNNYLKAEINNIKESIKLLGGVL